MHIIGRRVDLKPYLSMKAIGHAFGFRSVMIAKGASAHVFKWLTGCSRGVVVPTLGIIMIDFHPLEPSGWPDLLLFLLPNERAKGVLLVFFLNPA